MLQVVDDGELDADTIQNQMDVDAGLAEEGEALLGIPGEPVPKIQQRKYISYNSETQSETQRKTPV